MNDKQFPHCEENRCFAFIDWHCTILTDSDFNGRKCPFYKTNAQVKEEQALCKERLENIRK